MMKFAVVLAFLGCIATALAACCYDRCLYTEGHSGRVNCAAGDKGKVFRNNNDPTKYWICNGAGPAECASCPVEWLFSAKDEKCVCFADWVWTPPCDPQNKIEGALGCEACVVPGTGSGGTGVGCGCGTGSGSGSGSGGGSVGCGCV